MSRENSVITDWKRLWPLVSGIHHETPENTVLEELMNVSKELQDGVLQFHAKCSTGVRLEDLLMEKKQEKLLLFTQRLQELLDLESKQCWEILCYYLTNEYRGSASSLTALISTESNMTKLLDDIWGYYTLERMIVLKIVKNVLLFHKTPNHPYQRQYKEVLEKIALPNLRDSYLGQLDHLINECPPHKLTGGEFFDYHSKLAVWSERNAREINEVLHILLLIFEYLPVGLPQVKQLFACFRQHSFGKQQRYLDISNDLHRELIARLTYSEVVLFLKCVDLDASEPAKQLAVGVIDALDKDITRMYHNPENGPLLLAWMLLKMRFTNVTQDEASFLPCRQFGKRAIDLNCFKYLHDLLTNAMFKDDSLVSRIARRTIYNLLCYMCDFFDGDGSCSRHPFIFELLCELLSWPTLAKVFCSSEDGGVRSLYNTLLELFPLDFVHLSLLANALTKAGMFTYIKSQLECLPIFADTYDSCKYVVEARGDDEYELLEAVCPCLRVDFTIPAGTTAVMMSRPEGYVIHFRTSVNYYSILHHEINCLLVETVQQHGDWQCNERVCRVNAGLEYLQAVLQRTKALSAISEEMVHPTEMCIDLLSKFKTVQQPPVQLLANCLNVCTALLPLVDTEIYTRVINLHMLPAIVGDPLQEYKKYANGVCFDSRLVGSYLVDVERKLECYDFLQAYLQFLRTYTKMQRNRLTHVEIPGLIFLLREVFPHMHSWRFKKFPEKYKVYTEVMGFVCDILDAVTSATDKESDSEKNAERQLLRDICVYSLLNLENGLVLLRFIALGNAYLQHTMEMESNWMIQQSHGVVLLVRLAMRILMQLLRLKAVVFDSAALSPLEALIYTQPKQRDTLRIIPVVTSYMSNIFDRWLPILSCRLLRRIALEFNMSLLACLDMEPDQIRLTFLQRLPDELESDSLKIAILELVEACIEKQPGVTEAFFKVNYAQEKRIFGKEAGAQIADSILTYVEDYLEAVAKEPHTVEHALPSKIMSIFHSLWKHNMQILVEELTKKPTFWEQLCNPLFGTLRPNLRVYTQLLNIMAIEVFSSTCSANPALVKVVQRFFEPEQFKKFLYFVFDMPETTVVPSAYPANDLMCEEMPEWLCRLQAFKSFMVILLKKQPHFIEVSPRQLKVLAEECLEVLVDRAEYVEDLRPFIILTELYLFVLLSFKHSYTDSPEEDSDMLHLMIQLLGRVACCYEDLHVRAKEACLALTIKCSDLVAAELLSDSNAALTFLHSVVTIICTELQNLENCVRAEMKAKQELESLQHTSSNSLILSLNLLKTVANIFHNAGPGNWDLPFIINKVFQRLLSCTSSILQLYNKQTLSVELLDVLIVFAKGNCSAEFLHCDVGDYLWLKLLPPKDLLQVNFSLSKPRPNTWTAQKWWPIYARGIELVTILFEKHKNYFVPQALQFVGIHQEYMVDALLLGKQSLEPTAMELIKSAITLLANLVAFEKQWRLEHSQSLFNLMRAVQMLMGHSISMFHQPKNLKCLVAGRSAQLDILRDNESAGFVDEVITAFNDLTEIIILCAKCLQRFSPDLLELLCAPEFSISAWEPIFEIHFGAPKLNENAVVLTFGTVLSIVGVYTKVLNLKNHGFDEAPLNVLPSSGNAAETPTSSAAGLTASRDNAMANRTHRPFSKSLSIASVSSVNCPPNELLSNLDGELCLMALEHILMLAASQSMLALKNDQLPVREKQLVKREISAELLSYHEFVRKKVLIDYREHKEIWHRRKHGLVLMHTMVPARTSSSSSSTTTTTTRSSSSSNTRRQSSDLRVNVVRRLHLMKNSQRTPASSGHAFEMSHAISPISGTCSRDSSNAAISSTPNLGRPPLRRLGDEASDTYCQSKRTYMDGAVANEGREEEDYEEQEEEEEEEIEYFPPEEPSYSPLSYVQLVEEDYLHFMSNLFMVICQSD